MYAQRKPPKTGAVGMTPEMAAGGRWRGVASLVGKVKAKYPAAFEDGDEEGRSAAYQPVLLG